MGGGSGRRRRGRYRGGFRGRCSRVRLSFSFLGWLVAGLMRRRWGGECECECEGRVKLVMLGLTGGEGGFWFILSVEVLILLWLYCSRGGDDTSLVILNITGYYY